MTNLGQMLKPLRRERERAQNEVDRLDEAIIAFEKLTGTNSLRTVHTNSKGTRKFSAAARKRMSRAQKARWAKLRE